MAAGTEPSTAPATMRALVLADFGRMVVEERPLPELPRGHAMVRVVATGICGSDLHGFTGENGRRQPGQVMGHETAGRVIAYAEGTTPTVPLGSPVTVNPTLACGECDACRSGSDNLCTRRRVIGVDPAISSAFAEYMAVPAANLVPLRPDLPIELGALVEPLAVGAHAVARGGIRAGEAVGVIGGGPIGQAVLLAALAAEASRVVVVEPLAERRKLVVQLGGEAIEPGPGALAAAAGESLPVVIDAVGSAQTVGDALASCRRGGRVVLVGMRAPRLDLSAYALSTDERALVGAFCYSDAQFRATADWAASNTSRLRHLVSAVVPLAAAPEAFRRLATEATGMSKILVALE